MSAKTSYSPKEWIEKAKQKISGHEEAMGEIEFMVSSDYSKNKWRVEHAKKCIEFLEAGIKFAESQL